MISPGWRVAAQSPMMWSSSSWLRPRATCVANRSSAGQLRAAHRLAQPGEHGVLIGGDHHPRAIGAAVDVGRRDAVESGARRSPHHTAHVVIGDGGFLYRQTGFGQRDVDHLAMPGDAAAIQRGQRALGAEHAGQAVTERQRQPGWRTAGKPVEVPQSTRRFGDRGVAGLVRVGSGLSVARHPDQDDARIALAEHVVSQVPFLQGAGTEVLHHDVGFLDEVTEQLAAAGTSQVQGDCFFVARVHGPEDVVPAELGLAPGAQRVRGTGGLDLDHVGAHVPEQPPGEGSGDQGAQLEHPYPVQRPGGIHHGLAKSWRTSQSVTILTAALSWSRCSGPA